MSGHSIGDDAGSRKGGVVNAGVDAHRGTDVGMVIARSVWRRCVRVSAKHVDW